MDILKSKVRPLYFSYLAASAGSAMVGCIFGMVDAMMVGKYHGPSGTAALAVFNPLWTVIFGLGMLAGIGSSVLFANHRGRGDEKSAQQYFTLAVIYGLALSAAAMLGIGLFREELFRFFGADDRLLELALMYLRPIFFAIPFSLFSTILSAYLRNDGNPGLATAAVLGGGAFNVVGDYVFVFVCDMGIAGAGLATAIGQVLTALFMLPHFFGKKNTLRLVRPEKALRKLGRITALGFSTGINDLAMGVICVCFNRQIMTYLNADALAVYGIITQVTAFAQCLAYGSGQAAQPIISQNYGAGQFSRIRKCVKYGLYTSAVFGLFWTALAALTPEMLVKLFMDPTPAVLQAAPGILRTYGVSYLLLPFNIFATYYFQAAMRSGVSLALSLGRGVIISGAAIMLLPAVFGPDSVWLAMPVTEVLVAAFGAVCMVRSAKRLS